MSFFVPLLFFLGSMALSAFSKALRLLGPIQAKQLLQKQTLRFTAYMQHLLTHERRETFTLLMSFTKYTFRLLYALSFFFYLLSFPFLFSFTSWPTFPRIVLIVVLTLLCELCFRALAKWRPTLTFHITALPTTVCLLLLTPLTYPLTLLQKLLLLNKKKAHNQSQTIKNKLTEWVYESEWADLLEPQNKHLVIAIASFQERVVREVMVPRIHLFALPATQTLGQVIEKCIEEGYSRIPIYESSIDHITGLILTKDVLRYCHDAVKSPDKLDTPLKDLLSPVIYTPETKKISQLLQEFRHKQNHLAVVVDEYGGTKGIVTIEDILEELVGEIDDEYDIDEEAPIFPIPQENAYIVDANLSLIDLEKQLKITLPQRPEYETIGGYLFYKAGTIPPKGWKLHLNQVDIEVIKSNERTINQVKIHKSAAHQA